MPKETVIPQEVKQAIEAKYPVKSAMMMHDGDYLNANRQRAAEFGYLLAKSEQPAPSTPTDNKQAVMWKGTPIQKAIEILKGKYLPMHYDPDIEDVISLLESLLQYEKDFASKIYYEAYYEGLENFPNGEKYSFETYYQQFTQP